MGIILEELGKGMIDKEFLQAADDLVSAYRVLRRLAGRAILERDQMKKKLEIIENILTSRRNAGETHVLLEDLEDAFYFPGPAV